MTRAERLINILRQSSLLVNYYKGYGPGFPRIQRKYKNGNLQTYCNQYARDVMNSTIVGTGTGGYIGSMDGSGLWPDGFNLDLSFMAPNKTTFDIIINTLPNEALSNVILAVGKGVTELTAGEAQQAANDGVLVWAATYGHEAIVSPNFLLNNKGLFKKVIDYRDKFGPMVGQTGNYSGRAFVSDYRVWGNSWHDVRYFVFPVKE